MNKNRPNAIATLLAASILAGCAVPGYGPSASQPYPQPYPQQYPQYPQYPMPASAPQPYSGMYGVIDSIQMVQAPDNTSPGIGAGAVIGGVVGGVLGNQVGGGRGRTAATVAGAVGGAVVGNQIEQRRAAQARNTYQIGIRMDNGSYRTVVQDYIADLRIGGRVRVEGDRVLAY
ncbi:MAG: glycine zipper protein [Noviherbaspirillum sp.]|nr:glycine zipper protein [Noviherbaspirillum sp.]